MVFTYGNTYNPVENPVMSKNGKYRNNSRWVAFIVCNEFREETDAFIDSVVFKIHETFNPNTIEVNSAPFILSRVGWGYFDMKMHVTFKKWTGI